MISYDAQLCPPSMPRYTSSPGFEPHTCTSASVVSSATLRKGGTSFTGTTSWRTTISRSPVCFTTWNVRLVRDDALSGTRYEWYTHSCGHTSPWYSLSSSSSDSTANTTTRKRRRLTYGLHCTEKKLVPSWKLCRLIAIE